MPPVIILVQKLPNQNQHNECETAIFECLRFIHLHLCIIDALEMLKVTYFTKIGKIFRSSETEGKKTFTHIPAKRLPTGERETKKNGMQRNQPTSTQRAPNGMDPTNEHPE